MSSWAFPTYGISRRSGRSEPLAALRAPGAPAGTGLAAGNARLDRLRRSGGAGLRRDRGRGGDRAGDDPGLQGARLAAGPVHRPAAGRSARPDARAVTDVTYEIVDRRDDDRR